MSDFDRDGHNPTVYLNEYEAKIYEKFGEPEPKEKHENGCWNCLNFNWKHEACSAFWNNWDESYYNPDTDGRELTDCCEYHEVDKDAVYEDIFEEDE